MHASQRDAVEVRAPAKVNLFLEILGKRPDGYHEIVTCMVAVDLCDVLTFTPASGADVGLFCDDSSLSTGPDNLVRRAAEMLRQQTGIRRGAHIRLQKRIPAAAGLGGGSSDAAATLHGLNQLWDLGLSLAALMEIAAAIGSDVPFFVTAGAAWCTGRGEQVDSFALKKPLNFVLACPAAGLSTAEVYQGVTVPRTPSASSAMKAALTAGSIPAIGAAIFNRLQPAAEKLCPELAQVRRVMEKLAPPGHGMSGSGSSYVALCRSRAEARTLARQVPRLYSPGTGPEEGRGLKLFVVRSCG
jgi:4-diphosphocytidyl-2-C-methyl-D-erythritol kinase